MLRDVLDIYIQAGITASKQGNPSLANKMLSAAIEESKNDRDKQIKLAIALCNSAETYAENNDYQQAVFLLRRAVQIYLCEDLNAAPLLDRLAELVLAQNKPKQALQFYKRAKIADEKFGLANTKTYISRLQIMACICAQVNRVKEAANLYTAASNLLDQQK